MTGSKKGLTSILAMLMICVVLASCGPGAAADHGSAETAENAGNAESAGSAKSAGSTGSNDGVESTESTETAQSTASTGSTESEEKAGSDENTQGSAPVSSQFVDNARISYLGPAGTYTEEAAQFFFTDGSFQPKETVQDAIADVTDGNADYAVIPQENTLGGAVTNYVDALIAQKDIYVVGEVILPINQTLMGLPDATLEDIRTVCSHAQGLTQSAEWRKEHLPEAKTQEMPSTAAAASYVAETGDKTIAAVAAPGAADLYGLSVLAENVQITDTNKTRFYVLSASRLEEQGDEKRHAVFVASCEANRIDDIIVEIHNAGLELVTIHDRPEGSFLGNYNYIIEVESESGVSGQTLETLGTIPELNYLGSFQMMEK